MSRMFAAVALATSLYLASPMASIGADDRPDFDVAGGHFYSQTNGTTQGASAGGFTISDADNIPFWTYLSNNGGTETLGYPISRRFKWDGYVCQVTQRAILQWNPDTKQVQLVNLFDYLSSVGKDDWLIKTHLAPRERAAPGEAPAGSAPQPFLQLAHYRYSWLYDDPALFQRYFNTPDYVAMYGLPTSPIEDLGPYQAVRFQRVVMYHWKMKVPWADSRDVSVGLGGDLFKELGLVPAGALQLELLGNGSTKTTKLPAITSPATSKQLPSVAVLAMPSAAPVAQPAAPVRPTTGVMVGVATWYGDGFQGQTMSNGYPFDMYDPSTTAANVYPMGTWLRVTRLSTGKSIVVRVTDRGGFRYPNICDLSYAAFSQLADPATGVIGVKVEIVSGPG